MLHFESDWDKCAKLKKFQILIEMLNIKFRLKLFLNSENFIKNLWRLFFFAIENRF